MPEIIKTLLVILPVVLAGIAHSVAIRADLFPWAAQRLDLGLRFFGEPLFGENKTWRGVLIMSGMTSVCAWLLSFVLQSEHLPSGFAQLAEPVPALLFGLLIGLGYSLGELPNSFVKRRLRVHPGSRPGGPGSLLFYFIDQTDSVAGIILFVWAVYGPPVQVLFELFAVGSLVHIAFDMLLYLFEVKKMQWRARDVSPGLICVCQTITYWACRLVMRLYPRYLVRREETTEIAQQGGKYIIAANHVRALDPFLASVALPWSRFKMLLPVRYMTHDGYIERTWQKLLMFPLGCFPAHKDGNKGGLELALGLLERGQTIFIFPEGRRVKGGSTDQLGLNTAGVGVAYLAARTGAKVLPVNIEWLDAEQRRAEGIGVVLHVGLELAVDGSEPDLQPVADGVLHRIYSLRNHPGPLVLPTTQGGNA